MDSKSFYQILKECLQKCPGLHFFFLFKRDQICFVLNVLWLQYISQWVWFENNKHRFHKLMSPVINSNFQTSLNSDSYYVWHCHGPTISRRLPWRQEDEKQENQTENIDRKWEELEGTTFVYEIQSSRPLFICTLPSPPCVAPAIEKQQL